MAELWFFLVAGMFAVYVALDGFDFGVGILHLFVAKTRAERAQTLRSIGPVWDGNEVWLVAAGGTLLAAFPALFGIAFSGFYLPLMCVLWLLVFRGLGIELKHQLHDPLWEQFWDVAFALSSALLAVCFAAALGNVVRGLSLGPDGNFFVPLWTDFGVGENPGVFDWYTLLVAGFGAIALALHGAAWLCARTDGQVLARSQRLLLPLFAATALLLAVVSGATLAVNPEAGERLVTTGPGLALATVSIALFCAGGWFGKRGRFALAFRASTAFVVVTILGAAWALFPNALHATGKGLDLPVARVAADAGTLAGMLWWWLPGVAIAVAYTWFSYRSMPRTFGVADSDGH
jgi:cytochrome d ubiquinol oxidase subunit II